MTQSSQRVPNRKTLPRLQPADVGVTVGAAARIVTTIVGKRITPYFLERAVEAGVLKAYQGYQPSGERPRLYFRPAELYDGGAQRLREFHQSDHQSIRRQAAARGAATKRRQRLGTTAVPQALPLEVSLVDAAVERALSNGIGHRLAYLEERVAALEKRVAQ